MKLIYIAGPYAARIANPMDSWQKYHIVEGHILEARKAAHNLIKWGIGYYCPHLNSAHFETIAPQVPNDFWYEMDLKILRNCDAVYLLPNWKDSVGTRAEVEFANNHGIRVFDTDEFTDLVKWVGEEGDGGN